MTRADAADPVHLSYRLKRVALEADAGATPTPEPDSPEATAPDELALGPVAWACIGAAFTAVAAVPVLSAAIGPVAGFHLILYPAALIGGIAGDVGLVAAGLVDRVRRTLERRGGVRSARNAGGAPDAT